MARPTRKEQRQAQARGELATKGWTLITIGALLLASPALVRLGPPLSNLGVLGSMGPTLRPVGWLAVGLGVLFLLLRFIAQAPKPAPAAAGREGARPGPRQPLARDQEPARHDTLRAALEPEASPPTAPAAAPRAVATTATTTWGPALLAGIEWRRFEALCEAFYAQVGLQTRSQSHGADGGVDIWLQSRHMEAPRIVQCKHWRSKQVGVKELREFLGVMAAHQLRSGTFVTSSTFTAQAVEFAQANGILLQDGAALLKLIGQRTPEQQAALLAVAHEGEYWRPTCASCGIKTVRRNRTHDNQAFWGCSNYPRCNTRFPFTLATPGV